MYCEKIDFGDEIREIASGLQKFIPIAEMSGLVVVAMNLKPKKVANFMSNGMVLCASGPNKSKIEIMRPPADAKLGERVKLEGQEALFKDAK